MALRDDVYKIIGTPSEAAQIDESTGEVVKPAVLASGLCKGIETIMAKPVSHEEHTRQIKGIFQDRFGYDQSPNTIEALLLKKDYSKIIGMVRQADHNRGIRAQNTRRAMESVAPTFGILKQAFTKTPVTHTIENEVSEDNA